MSYVFLPVYNLVKFSLVAGCLSLGLYISTGRMAFGVFFGVAVVAELVMLVPGLLKLLWFLFVKTDYTLQDLQVFQPLSALSFFDHRQVEPWLLYPLQLLNVFELVYWFALAFGLTRVIKDLNLERAMGLVLSSYGVGLLVWVAASMLITLSYAQT